MLGAGIVEVHKDYSIRIKAIRNKEIGYGDLTDDRIELRDDDIVSKVVFVIVNRIGVKDSGNCGVVYVEHEIISEVGFVRRHKISRDREIIVHFGDVLVEDDFFIKHY